MLPRSSQFSLQEDACHTLLAFQIYRLRPTHAEGLSLPTAIFPIPLHKAYLAILLVRHILVYTDFEKIFLANDCQS